MKSKSYFSFFLYLGTLLFVLNPVASFSSTEVKINQEIHTVSDCHSTLFAPLVVSELTDLSVSDVEHKLDRELSFKEKMSFKLIKRYAKRVDGLGTDSEACSKLERKAKNCITFGIIGLFIAGFIFGLLAIIHGSKAVKLAEANPDCPDSAKRRKKGKTGIVLGVIDIIGAIALVAILA